MKVFDYFNEICSIPHCSFETDKLKEYLMQFSKDSGFSVNSDEFGNIYAIKGKPNICLQAHYDMVCVGDAPNIEIIKENGFLKAKNSTLGADNGIGVAIIMDMMREFESLEVLFTNNEEVGLLGANGFNTKLVSGRILNLDSEHEDGVFIGCASGVGIFASSKIETKNEINNVYEVEISGLKGGHSGIEIVKDIPNAIKLLADFLAKSKAKIVSINGGERNNSIPVKAVATVICDDLNLQGNSLIKVKKLGTKDALVLKNSDCILSFINSFAQGVRSYDESLKIVNESINLSIIKQDKNMLEIEFFARSMSDLGLERIKSETEVLAKMAGFDVRFAEESRAWTPKVTDFAKEVLSSMQEFNKNVKFEAVHAGLECGVLLSKQSGLEACSIGPNIYSPHSINECCEINSVDLISRVVKNIVRKYQN